MTEPESLDGELAEGAMDVAGEGATITLDFKEADVKSVLRVISVKSGINIVAGPEVEGLVTIRLSGVTWRKALDVVLKTYGYVYEESEGIIRVTTAANLASEELSTETFILNYATAAEVVETLQDLVTERGSVKAATRANAVIVTDVGTNIRKLRKVVDALDRPTPQVYIDSKVVRTELERSENLGIDWNVVGGLSSGTKRPVTFPFFRSSEQEKEAGIPFVDRFFPQTASGTTVTQHVSDPSGFPRPALSTTGGDFTFGTMDFNSFSIVLQMLRTRSNTKVVSNPRIVVLNNQTATVQVGDEIGIPTFERNETTGSFEVTGYEMRKTGVTLNVTPHVNSASEILVELKPEVSSFTGFTDIGTTNLSSPRFATTNASTQVMVRDGETIAIGGLLTDGISTTEDKVPVLGDIPVVGKLFRSKRETAGSSNEKVETLFFVTITVVDTEGQPVAQGVIV